MKRMTLYLLLVAMLAALLLPMTVFAADTSSKLITGDEVVKTFNESKNSVKGTYRSSKGTNLPYRLYVPDDYDPNKSYPLVLFFHGAGERGEDNTLQISAGSVMQRLLNNYEKAAHPCIILAPQCTGTNDNKWVLTPWEPGTYDHTKLSSVVSPYMQAAEELLDKVIADYSVDESRLYVTGMSMGGFGTWDIISRNPDKFAAAIPVCGGVDVTYLEVLKGMPIWTFHNDGDTIVSSQGTKLASGILKGDNFTYTEFKSTAHDAWTAAYSTETLTEWLFSQVKESKVTYPTVEGITFNGPESVKRGAALSFNYTVKDGYGLKSLTVGGNVATFADGKATVDRFVGGEIKAEIGQLCNIKVEIKGKGGSLVAPTDVFVGDEVILPIEVNEGGKLKEVKAGDTVLTANEKGEYILKADKADITVTVIFDGGSSNTTLIMVIAIVAAVVIGAAAAGIVLAKKKKS